MATLEISATFAYTPNQRCSPAPRPGQSVERVDRAGVAARRLRFGPENGGETVERSTASEPSGHVIRAWDVWPGFLSYALTYSDDCRRTK